MNHFVGEHPVGVQMVLVGWRAHGDSNEAAVARKGLTAAHASAVERADLQREMRHGITSVVCDDCVSGFLHPLFELRIGNFQRVAAEGGVDLCGSGCDGEITFAAQTLW